jgi:tight adherence protein B
VVRVLKLIVALMAGGAAAVLARAAWRGPVRARANAFRRRRAWSVPARPRGRLERALRDADLGLSPEDAVVVAATATVVLTLLAGAVNPAAAPLAFVGALVAGPVGLVVARGRAQRAFLGGLPPFVEFIAAQLRSGHTVPSALVAAGDRPGPLGGDARRLQQRVALGATLPEALGRWAGERRSEPAAAVAGALAVAAETGGAAGAALDGLARSLRDALGAQAEAAALSAQARLSAIVVGVAPIAYLVFAAATDPHAASTLVSTSSGRVCLVLGLALDALGALWMRRITRSAP